MSGLGHFAPAFTAKSVNQTVPFWVWLVASEANDILYILFSATGIEPKTKITVMDFQSGVRYLTPVVSPWSHGLFMSVFWSVIASTIAFLIYRNRHTSALIGLVVLSHWILDFLMHSNLPVFFSDSPQVGLGLENTGIGFLVMTSLDILLLITGVVIYVAARRRSRQNLEPVHV